jgi:serine phosphatase RsbU (regulator of sigma subunit)
MLVTIQDGIVRASSAGMPPFYVHPLGAVKSFDYQTIETKLEPGGTVLLMSDGFPKLFNDQDEMLDYDRIKEIFKEASALSADGIVNRLFTAGDNRRNGHRQMDDITLTAFKYQPKKSRSTVISSPEN